MPKQERHLHLIHGEAIVPPASTGQFSLLEAIDRIAARVQSKPLTPADLVSNPERVNDILDLLGIAREGEAEPRYPVTEEEDRLGLIVGDDTAPEIWTSHALRKLVDSRRETMDSLEE